MIHEMDILVEMNPLLGGTYPLFGLTDWNEQYSPISPSLLSELLTFNRVKNPSITAFRSHVLLILNDLEKIFPYCHDFKIIKKIDENGNEYYDLIGLIETPSETNLFTWRCIFSDHREIYCYNMSELQLKTAIEEMESLIKNVKFTEENLKNMSIKLEVFKTILFLKYSKKTLP